MKFLHIIKNDKFSPVEVFDSTNSQNEYICELNTDNEEILYLDINKVKGLYRKEIINNIKLGDYDAIVFHSLREDRFSMVQAVPNGKLIIWILFGFEVYKYPLTYRYIKNKLPLYKTYTKKWLKKKDCSGFSIRRYIKQIKTFFYESHVHKSKEREQEDLFHSTMRRIDYIVPVYDTEMELLKEIPSLKAKFFPFQYTKWHLKDNYITLNFEDSKSILLGNSADPTNNHIDVINLLQKRNITNHLYIPLAYGREDYKNHIRDYVENNKIDAYIQNSMIPYEEYLKHLNDCRIAIMPHMRQQASDTIHISLLRGCKVFMYKGSIGYKYFRSKGFIVFSIENDLNRDEINKLLTSHQIEHNRGLVLNTVSFEVTCERLQKAINELKNTTI